jgi:hypothetical protein
MVSEVSEMIGNFKCTECEYETKGALPNISNVVYEHYKAFGHKKYIIIVGDC